MPKGRVNGWNGQGFASRHQFLLVLLWLQVPALAAVGLILDEPLFEVVASSVVLCGLALSGMLARTRHVAQLMVVVGLLTASAVVVRYAGGSTFAHFHFLIMIGAISLYQEWAPLVAGVLVAVGYHLALPGNDGDRLTTFLIHSGVITALAILLSVGWHVGPPVIDARAASDRFRLSFERAPIGMAVLKPSGEVLEANESMERVLGYGRDQLVGVNVTSLIHPDDQSDLGAAWEEMGNGTAHSSSGWMRCLSADGPPIWGRVSFSLIPRAARQPAMVILQLEDVTGPQEEQRRLERLIKDRDEFVATVGDEIKVPLSVLIDLTDTAENSQDDVGDTLPRIEAHAREIASILDDLVMSARAETTPIPVVAHVVDAEHLCDEVIRNVAGGRKIVTDFRATQMWADPLLARQIVTGLVNNAVRYGGPEIAVRTIRSGPDTVIQVFDSGPEIPTSERDRIFAGDLRSGTPVTRPASVGLSLTVGRHLARLMEGDVVYRRTAEGRNVFELRLPSEPISRLPRRRGIMSPSTSA